MRSWSVGLVLAAVILGAAAKAETVCEGVASGSDGVFKATLFYDETGVSEGESYSWRLKSPGAVTLSTLRGAGADGPADYGLHIEAIGKVESGVRGVTMEVSLDGAPALTSFVDRPLKVTPRDAKPSYMLWLDLDTDTFNKARRLDITIKADGVVLETWSYIHDLASQEALSGRARDIARKKAARPRSCPAPAGDQLILVVAEPAMDWLTKPSKEDLLGAYPRKARSSGIVGQVVLGCEETRSGDLVYCKVEQETPAGLTSARRP